MEGYEDKMSGMLSDNDIRYYFKNGIDIFTSESEGDLAFDLEKQLQLGSIDLRFRHEYKRFNINEDKNNILTYDMLKNHEYTKSDELTNGQKLRINPGEIILTTTLETVQLSENFAGIITGRSSIGRLGVMVHCCAEYIKPGHGQPIPLQLVNLSPYVIELDLKVPVCQMIFFKLLTSSSGKYINKKGAKYAKEIGPESSKIYEESASDTYTDSNILIRTGKLQKIKQITRKYLMPFLPAIIMLLLITPMMTSVKNKSISDILNLFKTAALAPIIGILFLVIYIWTKKGDSE